MNISQVAIVCDSMSRDCGFSIDIVSKEFLDTISMLDTGSKGVTIEGSLGELQNIVFLDGSVLVITCENGVFRIDLTLDDFRLFVKRV